MTEPTTTTTTDDAAPAAAAPPDGDDTSTGKTSPDSSSTADLDARLAELEADRDKWKAQARKHEQRSRDNAQAASQAQTLEQQIEQLRNDIAGRDARDTERNQRLALAEMRTQIAAAGVKPADVADLLELVDPARLLTNGELDDKAIAKIAASIARTGGRPQPDPDQGKTGGGGTPDMNTLIRRAAGVSTS